MPRSAQKFRGLIAAASAAPVAVVRRDHRVPLVAIAVAVEAVAAAIPIAFAVPGGAAAEIAVAVALEVHAAVVVAGLGAALVLGMAIARLVAVARLDLALHVAAPGAPRSAVLDALGAPAVRPAAVGGVVAVDVGLPAGARTAIGIGHLVLGVVRADERLVVSSAESHANSFLQGAGRRGRGADGVFAGARGLARTSH